jgi:hypothetical protein
MRMNYTPATRNPKAGLVPPMAYRTVSLLLATPPATPTTTTTPFMTGMFDRVRPNPYRCSSCQGYK